MRASRGSNGPSRPWSPSPSPSPPSDTRRIISVAAVVTGLLRLILRERSPWKVRSVAFDAFIGIALGIGLLAVHFSVGLLG